MAFNAQNRGVDLSPHGTNADPSLGGVGTKGLLGGDNHRGTGITGDVCDPPHVYNAGLDAHKTTRHVNDEGRERTYERPDVQETVVHHEVERIKPVIHQEVHQTRLHETTHHKVEAPRDLGITEVVQHRDTDPCGNRITEDLNAVRGTGTGAKGIVENLKDKITGHHNTTGYGNDQYAAGGVPPVGGVGATGTGPLGAGAGAAGAGYGTTGAYDNNTTTGTTPTLHEPTGVKGMINKVVPGPGPFKPTVN